jgi:HAD superfamily hydrolase (TIGR01509 family)
MDKKIKGVIFDVDGVLLDSMGMWMHLAEDYVRKLGADPEENLTSIVFSMSMEQGAEYISKHYPVGMTAQEIRDGISDTIRDFYFNEVKAKPGAEELMKAFRAAGIKMTVATASPHEHIERALERNGLSGYIDGIFTCADMGSSKHEPDIFHAAAAHIGTKPEETLVFEDSLYALRTAAEAGFHAVGVYDADGETDQEGMKETAEVYIRDLTEFEL